MKARFSSLISTVLLCVFTVVSVRFARNANWISGHLEAVIQLSIFVFLAYCTWIKIRIVPTTPTFRYLVVAYFMVGISCLTLGSIGLTGGIGKLAIDSLQVAFWSAPFALIWAHVQQHARTKAELDDLVASRTKELTASNIQLQREICQRMDIANELHQAKGELEELIVERTKKAEVAERALIRHERLLALGQMSSGIAHELNNTLTPVVSYANMLSNKAELPTAQLEWVNQIAGAAADAVRVVKNLQQFYRDEVGDDFAPLELGPIVQQVVELTRPVWKDDPQSGGRTVELELDLQQVPRVSGKPSQIRQVLTNLVLNASESVDSDGEIAISLFEQDAQVCVSVRDNGRGMSENDIKCCFDPFYTTKQDGTGLGLSVCHGIVKNHGGSIDVESSEKGTRFIVRLPVAYATELSLPEAPLVESQVDEPPVELLFVEDHDGVRLSVSCMLEASGINVTATKCAVEALSALKVQEFDLVFTDLGLPGIDGSQLTQEIRRAGLDLPIVVMSGWPQKKVVDGFDGKIHPNAIVSKPADLDEIIALISSLTGRYIPMHTAQSL